MMEDTSVSTEQQQELSTDQPENLKRFVFRSPGHDESEVLEVLIPQQLDPTYGMYTWPCAPVLAQYVWYHRKDIYRKNILELGAGTALPGVVAAKCGANVAFSDDAMQLGCLENSMKSCQVNGVNNAKFHAITWGQFTKDLMSLTKVDIIMASDCFYDNKDYEDIIVTVSYLLDKNPGAVFWCTYQERSSDESIEDLLQKWELKGVEIALSHFGADAASVAESDLPGNHTIHMLEIAKMLPYSFAFAGCVC